MSIAGFFAAVRDKVLPPPTQHDLALKAMSCVANGAARAQMYRAPKRNIHRGPVIAVPDGDMLHKLPTPKNEPAQRFKTVPLKYQTTVDASRYPFAHYNGYQHPGWLTGGRA